MITPYVRPQNTITQILQPTATRTASRRNPIVVGPQYNLYLNDGRDLSKSYVDFSSDGEENISYTDTRGVALDLTKLTPQADDAELYGNQLQALVASFNGAPNSWRLDTSDLTYRTLRISANNVAGSGTLNAGFDGRAVRVGDVVSSTWTTDDPEATGTTRRKVVALAGKITPAVVPEHPGSVSPFNPVSTGATTTSLVAENTSVGLTVTAGTMTSGDVKMLRVAGKVFVVGGKYKLADQLDFVCVVGGTAGTATFNITSVATGVTTASPVASVNDSGFLISLDTVGYSSSAAVILAKSTAMVAGDRIRVMLQPVFTPIVLEDGNLDIVGTYVGKNDRRYAIEVISFDGDEDYAVSIYDVTGEDTGAQYTTVIGGSGPYPLGTSGLSFSPDGDADGICKGQIFYVDIKAARVSNTEFTGLVLDGPAVPSAAVNASADPVSFTNTSVFQVYSGVLNGTNTQGVGDALLATSTNWTYESGLGLLNTATGRTSVTFSPFADTYGSVYVSFKALVKPLPNESIIELYKETDIVTTLGEADSENWLGRGAIEAFRGNQGQAVFALRTGGDSVEHFTTALRKIQTTDRVYALVGLTDRLDVMKLLRDHCVTMSNKFNKNFRRVYVGTDSPGSYLHWGALPGGSYRVGDLSSSIVTLQEAYREASKFVAADVGSLLTVQSIGQSYTVLEVLSDFEALTDAPDSLTVSDTNLTLTRTDTPTNTALYVIDRSIALGSRRIVNVWSDDPTVTERSTTKVLPNKFVAAEIAGLRCALLPQQGLTMTELLSVTAAPSMYTAFDPADLDRVAANGTFVVTQESEGGDVFIRHQLTTSTTEGALAYEDNVGVIVDEFSYAVKDALRSYVGRRNATPDTIAEIRDRIKALALDFTQVDLVNRLIGPPVLAFFNEAGVEGEVTVRQDGDLADTLMTYVKLRIPLPLNGINSYIDVEVAELLASQDN